MNKKKSSSPFAGRRDLTVRVKTAKKRSTSSTLWLQRQLNDPYVQQAKRDGYASRAAYKILELDEKYRIFKHGYRVVDLGAAPGGWSQVAARAVGSQADNPHVVALDVLDMSPIKGVHCLQCDIEDEGTVERIHALLQGKVHVVLSDMAPNTTGHAATDHIRIVALCELAYAFACETLMEGGTFICKVRQGGAEHSLLQDLKKRFKHVSHFKPQSSRKESPETYLVAREFKNITV
ncbi:MAG: RlmE family RNA methyltransferase [Alphaproteobacteria bacterium]|nr:MAG: RlmE family RNA methyltransferase [Alphaproteobacteria bacterium]TAF39151.1 MAG: RlmE family RNA methyltransferase [Alphaproteobacteria bacterium]TAF77478.1 MAG: RlmE family RNA methyltransferase [Alphaproteobacteria bacterium]